MVWYETSLEESFPSTEQEDGTSISSWNDINSQLTKKNNAEPLYYDDYPSKYKENIFNEGIPGVYVTGGASLEYDIDYLNNSSFTFFVVEKKKSLRDSTRNYVIGGWGNVNGESFSLSYEKSGSTVTVHSGIRGSTLSYTETGLDKSKTTIHTFMFDRDTGSSYWMNGGDTADASNSDTTPFTNPSTIEKGRFGNYFYFNTIQHSFDGYIGEFIIYSKVLRDKEREAVEKYLSQKYNVPLS